MRRIECHDYNYTIIKSCQEHHPASALAASAAAAAIAGAAATSEACRCIHCRKVTAVAEQPPTFLGRY